MPAFVLNSQTFIVQLMRNKSLFIFRFISVHKKGILKMAKRGGFPGGMGGFGGMNINQLMKEAKKMQADMEKSA